MAHGVSSVASALETILAFTDQCLYSAEHIRAFADNFVAGEHFICEARDAIVGGIVGGNGRPDLEEILRVLHRIQPTVPRVVLRRNIRSDHGEGAEDVQNLVGGDTASWIPCPGLLRSEFIHQILPQCIRYLSASYCCCCCCCTRTLKSSIFSPSFNTPTISDGRIPWTGCPLGFSERPMQPIVKRPTIYAGAARDRQEEERQ